MSTYVDATGFRRPTFQEIRKQVEAQFTAAIGTGALALAPRLVPESRDPSPGPLDPVSVALSLAALLPLVWAIKAAAHDGLSWTVGVGFARSE